MVVSDGREFVSSQGSPIFDTLDYINQITIGFTLREGKIAAAAFERFFTDHIFTVHSSDYWFDGTGVRVFAEKEQPLLS